MHYDMFCDNDFLLDMRYGPGHDMEHLPYWNFVVEKCVKRSSRFVKEAVSALSALLKTLAKTGHFITRKDLMWQERRAVAVTPEL